MKRLGSVAAIFLSTALLPIVAVADEPAVPAPEDGTPAPRMTEPLLIEKGTFQLGGNISLGFTRDLERERTSFYYYLAPHIGVFLVDGLELKLNLSHQGSFDERSGSADNFGFGVGLRYIFDTGTVIYPHLGADVGLSFTGFANDPNAVATAVSVPLGILIALNRHVALDVGIAFSYRKQVGGRMSDHAGYFHVPFGYWGVEAFF